MTLLNRQLCLDSRPQGVPTANNVRMRSARLRRPGPGQVLLQNLYLSMDPAIRGWMSDKPSYMPAIALGDPVRSSTSAGWWRAAMRIFRSATLWSASRPTAGKTSA